VALRYFNVFGRRQDPTSQYAAVVPRFIRAIADGRLVTVHGDGEQSRDFTYVENVVALVAAAADAPDAAAFYHVCRQLIARGLAQDAFTWLDRRSSLLGPRDLIPLRLDTLAAAGWRNLLRTEVEGLLIAPPGPVLVELLSAHLIRHPDDDIRNAVFARLERDPLRAAPANYSAYLSLFSAAGVAHDMPRMHWTAAHIKTTLHEEFRSLDVIGEALLDDNRHRRVENFLPALQPLPLEVSYALLEHYAPAP